MISHDLLRSRTISHRHDAFDQAGAGDAAALSRLRDTLGAAALLCKMTAEVPSLSLPNWIAMLTGLKPEIHGLLGNRGPTEQRYSSLFSVARQLNMPATLVGTPW